MISETTSLEWAEDILEILDEMLLETIPELHSDSIILWWIISEPAEA
tara:strand:- start:109 stop:249 length:141 start_codon:yes stop_codon:yes gene_type:complete